MKNVQVSDELYGKLKDFVVDPFDDTLETIVCRLVDIANKAKAKWSLSEGEVEENEEEPVNEEQEGQGGDGVFRTNPLTEPAIL